MKNIKLHLLVSFLIIILANCNNPKKQYEQAIREWSGKRILFPDSMRSIFGDIVPPPESDYTIVAYFDSVGCTGCRMKLQFWNEFMSKVDSLIGKENITLFLITESADLIKIKHLIRQNHFNDAVINDSHGSFKKLNHISNDQNLQTFLLNRNNDIVIIGNPTESKGFEKLYLKEFNNNFHNSYDLAEEVVEEYDFGEIQRDKEVKHVFSRINHTNDTLSIRNIVTSCECTTANVSSYDIKPNENYYITVTFKDTVIGDFTRSVILKYQDKHPDEIFEISGKIIQ